MKDEIKSRWKTWMFFISVGIILIIVYKIADSLGYLGSFFSNFISIITPFLAGTLIAYLIYIPERKIEGLFRRSKKKFIKKKARFLGIFTTYLILIIAIIILINVILPPLIESINELIGNLQNYYSTILTAYNNLPDNSILKTDQVYNALKELQNFDIQQYLSVDNIMNYVKGAVSIVKGIFTIFVTFVISIHVLSERGEIVKFCKRLVRAMFNKETADKIENYFYRANNVFFKYISGQCIDVLVMIVISIIVLNIMGIKYATLLGFTIGLFNIIPYFGAIVAIVIAGIITLFTTGFSEALIMIIVITIFQQIDANIINPKIVGKYVEISPILVILGVTIGGAYFGGLGMFLGVPVIAVIKILVNDYIDSRTNKVVELNKK